MKCLCLGLLALAMAVGGCGSSEKSDCQKLNDIHKEICGEVTHYPCACALCGKGWHIPERLGLPDIVNGTCIDLGSCEGELLVWAETCLENEPADLDAPPQVWIDNGCDPRHHLGIQLFDREGWYNPALPEVVDKGINTLLTCSE